MQGGEAEVVESATLPFGSLLPKRSRASLAPTMETISGPKTRWLMGQDKVEDPGEGPSKQPGMPIWQPPSPGTSKEVSHKWLPEDKDIVRKLRGPVAG